MSEAEKMEHFERLTKDVIHLARMGAEGRGQDVQALVRRMSAQYRAVWPDFSRQLAEYAPRDRGLRAAKRPMPVDADSRMNLARYIEAPLGEFPIMGKSLLRQLNQLVAEHQNPKALKDAGLMPCKAALLVGPPGVGKTMSAHWVAKQLNRPLVILDLASSISSFLGKTGQNVRQIFDFCKEFDCVLLLDEVDAIAKRRADETDLGELKRLVNVLLQELDDWPGGALLLAATNHPSLLDPAVWRRFESVIEFAMPTSEERSELIHAHLPNAPQPQAATLVELTDGMSHADIIGKLNAGKRTAVLENVGIFESVLEVLAPHVRSLPKQRRHDLSERLLELGVSQRGASELTGTSRNTLRRNVRSHNG